MNIRVEDNNEVVFRMQDDEVNLRAGDTINLGSSDYNDLTNKPSIEGVELVGDVSLDDLGVAYAEDIPTDVSELINDAGYITSPNVVFCTCDTAAGTAAKTATIVSGTLTELHAGDQAIVKFTNTNTASNPTLNIANTGAKAIKRYGTTAVGTTQATSWTAGTSFICVYDGTNWMLVSWINTAYSEISAANITSSTSSSTGLISGRRAKSAVEAFAPVTSVNGQTGDVIVTGGVTDVEVDGASVVSEGVAEITIPPLVTDLGYIDPEEYEEDVYVFMNTLTENGFYKFTFGGDDLTYFVAVQAVYLEGSDIMLVNQHYWGDEEGPITEYIRAIVLESDEVVDEQTTSYMTTEAGVNTFAPKSHTHYRTATAALSVWDYCNGSQITLTTDSPILYTDTRTPRHAWLIETTTTVTAPNRRFIRLTDLEDASIFYQRSGTYSGGVITWDDWYKFSGTVFTPPTGR